MKVANKQASLSFHLINDSLMASLRPVILTDPRPWSYDFDQSAGYFSSAA